MQVNTATLTRVDGNIALPALSFTLNLDAGSWVWGFDAAMPASALASVEPINGVPVELEATINGMAFRLLVDQISRDRTFNSATIRVSGRGKAALLDAPFAPVLGFDNTSAAANAQQLAAAVLNATEGGSAWSLAWGAVDWLVPAGAWSFNGTQIAALNAIAAAAGSYLQPHASDLQLQILPQYPAAPWDWSTIAPDYELPSAVVTREGIRWTDKPKYNRVFISGTGQGVLGQLTRTGTAGDLVAPMVTDPLITAAAAARQRGLPILADTGRRADVTLRLPVLTETGVILPGKFVRYTDGNEIRVGLVRSTALEVALPTVWQSIGVETHVD